MSDPIRSPKPKSAPGISTMWAPDKIELQKNAKPQDTEVQYPGAKYALVLTLQGKEGDDFDGAAMKHVGEMFRALWKIPKFREQAELLYIFDKPPLAPKVTFDFGELKLYLQASSMDHDVALRHGLDRLALAVLAVSQNSEAANAIKAAHCEVRSIR